MYGLPSSLQVNQLLEDLSEWLHPEPKCSSVEEVDQALSELADRCNEISESLQLLMNEKSFAVFSLDESGSPAGLCEQAINEGQNLLDQLSLPVKNAFGQDVSPDNSKHTEHVEELLGLLQERRAQAEDLAQARRLKLQQLRQLTKCETDAEQVSLLRFLIHFGVTS